MKKLKVIVRERLKSRNQNEFGITLIALIVTIVVLLILAGVTISTLTGNNGIITRANQAKTETEQAEKEEKYDLEKQADFINEYANGIEVEQVTDGNPGVLETEGTNTYVINSIEDLVFFAHDVTNGNTYEGKTVKLGLSLDFNSSKSYVDPLRTDYGEYGYNGELKTLLTSKEGFKPIGTIYDSNISIDYFKGTFDGNFNAIYNLYQNIENSEYVTIAGLFSTNSGTIKRLKVENVNINGSTNNLHLLLGGIAGRNLGKVEQCESSGKINVQADGTKGINVGGITGQCLSTENIINQCSSNMKININSTNINQVTVSGIGQSNETRNCYYTGEIVVTGENSGIKNISGIGNAKSISNCYNTGNIKVYFDNENADQLYIAGIMFVGGNIIQNCYNLGEIDCKNNKIYIAGIIANAQNGEINNCYNIGKLNAMGNIITLGSLTGYTRNQIIKDSKWLVGTAEKAIGAESENVTKNNMENIDNINNMPSILSVINSENCFKEDTNKINNGYPILNWQ